MHANAQVFFHQPPTAATGLRGTKRATLWVICGIIATLATCARLFRRTWTTPSFGSIASPSICLPFPMRPFPFEHEVVYFRRRSIRLLSLS